MTRRRWTHFNPLAPVGGETARCAGFCGACFISIHSPPWGGETPNPKTYISRVMVISIHSPPWGARRKMDYTAAPSREDFNPLAPVGGETVHKTTKKRENQISIHSPPWGGETVRARARRDEQPISIHSPPWGARLAAPWAKSALLIAPFQSTRPRGGRDCLPLVLRAKFPHISIHSPPWGARLRKHRSGKAGKEISIHSPPWGARPAQ